MTLCLHTPKYNVFFCVTIGSRPKVGDRCKNVYAWACGDVIGAWTEAF